MQAENPAETGADSSSGILEAESSLDAAAQGPIATRLMLLAVSSHLTDSFEWALVPLSEGRGLLENAC